MNIQQNSARLAETLNAQCSCITLDRGRLIAALQSHVDIGPLWRNLVDTHPHLFAATPTFISNRDFGRMRDVVHVVERLLHSRPFQDLALSKASSIAKPDLGPLGALMGYDFHVTPDGPRLIEINTNAGGAFLNAALREAQKACCADVEDHFLPPQIPPFEKLACRMFEREYHLQRPSAQLRTIAIVDDNPEQQYLYPEFVLARAILAKAGYSVVICDPSELRYDGHSMSHQGMVIDLVYNRLVDFLLEDKHHSELRSAYEAGAVVLTPNPHVHALLANKRNLVTLSSDKQLKTLGASSKDLEVLEAVPTTRLVTHENSELLWAERKKLFFKPLIGHGGKAVYRGDKMTLSAWKTVCEGDYIAQDLVKPGERAVKGYSNSGPHKMDVRLYTYAGEVMLIAARVYQGQTTNFRTPGGGFSPLFVVGQAVSTP